MYGFQIQRPYPREFSDSGTFSDRARTTGVEATSYAMCRSAPNLSEYRF